MNYKGTAHKVGEHIDTDAIIPARFLVTSDAKELGANCMAGLEPDWVKRVKPGDIMVAGRNFGCGSSREHAPIAILGAGMPVVIGHSFARIFYRNAFNMGLLLMEVGDDVDKINDGDELEVDAATGVIRDQRRRDPVPAPAGLHGRHPGQGRPGQLCEGTSGRQGLGGQLLAEGERGPFWKRGPSPPQTPPLLPKTFVPVDNGAGQDGDRALNICPPVVWGERAVEAGQERRLRKACPSRLSWGARTVFAHKRSAAALHEDIKMKKTICLLPGDGIGPEIVAQGAAVLEAVAKKFGHEFDFVPALIGGAAIDATGEPLPAATVEACQKADAVYLGAVGGPKWDNIEPARRPEKGLLGIRKALGLFANLRPALLLPELAGACLLRSDIAARGLDLIVVRELTGDIYFGEPRAIEERNGLRVGYNTMIYDENEIRRIAKVAFETARQRRKKVCSVEKSNVLETSRLWKAVVQEVHADYPDVELSHMYVDNAAMQLVRDPSQFDVILTGNIFGDILSDEASVITGSLGMLPSASMGAQAPALFEPIHGSAPDIAGQDKANPLATILSAGMMLRLAFGLSEEADAVENAVRQTLRDGFRTGDIMEDGCILVGCAEMGRLVAERL